MKSFDPHRDLRRHRQGRDGGLLRRRGHEDHRLFTRTAACPPCRRRRWSRRAATIPVSPRCAATSMTRRLPSSRSLPRSAARSLLAGEGAPVERELHQHRPPCPAGRLLLPRLRRPCPPRHGRCRRAVDYVVPTGNFGDILAGYFARELGLPIGTLVCASNANNVLTDFIRTGRYDKAPVLPHQLALDGHSGVEQPRAPAVPALRRRAAGGES